MHHLSDHPFRGSLIVADRLSVGRLDVVVEVDGSGRCGFFGKSCIVAAGCIIGIRSIYLFGVGSPVVRVVGEWHVDLLIWCPVRSHGRQERDARCKRSRGTATHWMSNAFLCFR